MKKHLVRVSARKRTDRTQPGAPKKQLWAVSCNCGFRASCIRDKERATRVAEGHVAAPVVLSRTDGYNSLSLELWGA